MEGEKEGGREKHRLDKLATTHTHDDQMEPATLACTLNQSRDLLVNQLSHTCQGSSDF